MTDDGTLGVVVPLPGTHNAETNPVRVFGSIEAAEEWVSDHDPFEYRTVTAVDERD